MKTSGYFNLDPGVELIGFYPYMVEKEAGFCLQALGSVCRSRQGAANKEKLDLISWRRDQV